LERWEDELRKEAFEIQKRLEQSLIFDETNSEVSPTASKIQLD